MQAFHNHGPLTFILCFVALAGAPRALLADFTITSTVPRLLFQNNIYFRFAAESSAQWEGPQSNQKRLYGTFGASRRSGGATKQIRTRTSVAMVSARSTSVHFQVRMVRTRSLPAEMTPAAPRVRRRSSYSVAMTRRCCTSKHSAKF